MQVLDIQGLREVFKVAKKQGNFFVPDAFAAELDALVKPHGVKRKWIVGCAALLMFFEATPEEQRAAFDKVYAADSKEGAFGELIEKARKKSGRKPVATHSPKQSAEFGDVAPRPTSPSRR